jgi:biotin operon repressor
MKTRDRILSIINKKKRVSGRELSSFLHISRQAVNRHLKVLIQKGIVVKEGHTKGARYSLPPGNGFTPLTWKRTLLIKGLEEHLVFRDVDVSIHLKKNLGENAYHIIQYAFLEILNNAIDHSECKTCEVHFSLDHYNCTFSVRDYGIGIFHSICSKYNIPNEISAAGELTKGKVTTAKDTHAGEGVYFTSKSGDMIIFRSHKIQLYFDNQEKDVFLMKRKMIRGTSVIFTVSRTTHRDLQEVFNQYSPEEYDFRFEKSKIFVKLFTKDLISRSEARRILSGMEKFSEIVLDFSGVDSIGQGFADEIFRIFKNQHPNISISYENTKPIVMEMIKHVVDKKI